MIFKLGNNTKKNLASLNKSGKAASSVLVLTVANFIKVTPIDFCVLDSGGYRTAVEQNALFQREVSKCDGLDKISKHQSGLAVDLVPWVDGKATWNRDSCFYLAGAFILYCREKGLPITSGADWNGDGDLKDGWDPCHMQIKEVL